MTFTRTHVRYFGDEELAPLRAAIDTLVVEWDARREHVSRMARLAGDLRIDMLTSAAALLGEPVAAESLQS